MSELASAVGVLRMWLVSLVEQANVTKAADSADMVGMEIFARWLSREADILGPMEVANTGTHLVVVPPRPPPLIISRTHPSSVSTVRRKV